MEGQEFKVWGILVHEFKVWGIFVQGLDLKDVTLTLPLPLPLPLMSYRYVEVEPRGSSRIPERNILPWL